MFRTIANLLLLLAGLAACGGCDIFIQDKPDTVVVQERPDTVIVQEDKSPDVVVVEDKTPDPPPDVNIHIDGN